MVEPDGWMQCSSFDGGIQQVQHNFKFFDKCNFLLASYNALNGPKNHGHSKGHGDTETLEKLGQKN